MNSHIGAVFDRLIAKATGGPRSRIFRDADVGERP